MTTNLFTFVLLSFYAIFISGTLAAEPTASPSPGNVNELNMRHEKKAPRARVAGVKPGTETAPGVRTGSGASDLDTNRNGSAVGAGIQIPFGRSDKSKAKVEDEDEEAVGLQKKAGNK